MTQDIVILLLGNKQQLSGFLKTLVPHFKYQKYVRMIKFHKKYFVESIPYEKVNPGKITQSN